MMDLLPVPASPVESQSSLIVKSLLGTSTKRGDRCRIALIIVVEELGRAAEKPALCIDVFLPDLLSEQRRFAVRSEPSGLRDAVADFNRLVGWSRLCPWHREHEEGPNEECSNHTLLLLK